MRKEKIMWLRAGMLGALVALLVLGVGGELGAQPKAEPVPFKIGIVTSLSGPGYGYGQRAVVGNRYRIEEEINKSGGINGHPVKLFIYDTGTKTDQAAMLAERAAVADKVFAILGPNASSDVAGAFATANRLRVPDFANSGILRGLCEKNAPWCFSAHVSDDFWAEPMSLLIDQFKVKTMVIMRDAKYNYAYTQAEFWRKIAERKGVKILHEIGKIDIETGWADFTPQITVIKSLKPDLIGAAVYPPDYAHLAIALKGAGIDPKVTPVFGNGGLMPDTIAAGGEATEGLYGSGDFDPESTDPLQRAWIQKVTAYGKSISTDQAIYTVNNNHSGGYISATFICEAIKRTKITPDTPLEEARSKIRDELPKIKMKVYSSEELRLGEGGRYEKNRIVAPVYLYQVKGGKMVTVGEVK